MVLKLSTALRRVLAQNPELLTPAQVEALLKAVAAENHEPKPKVTALSSAKTKEELLAAEAAWWA